MGEILETGQVNTTFFFKKLLDNVYLDREVAKQIVNEAWRACANLLSDLHLSGISRKPYPAVSRDIDSNTWCSEGRGEMPVLTPQSLLCV